MAASIERVSRLLFCRLFVFRTASFVAYSILLSCETSIPKTKCGGTLKHYVVPLLDTLTNAVVVGFLNTHAAALPNITLPHRKMSTVKGARIGKQQTESPVNHVRVQLCGGPTFFT